MEEEFGGHFTTWHRDNILWRLSMILRQGLGCGVPVRHREERIPGHGFQGGSRFRGLWASRDRQEESGDNTLHSSPISSVIIALNLLRRVWTLLSEDKAVSLHGELGSLGKGEART
jgi:hypothetical protein